jgi:hypothetical protein
VTKAKSTRASGESKAKRKRGARHEPTPLADDVPRAKRAPRGAPPERDTISLEQAVYAASELYSYLSLFVGRLTLDDWARLPFKEVEKCLWPAGEQGGSYRFDFPLIEAARAYVRAKRNSRQGIRTDDRAAMGDYIARLAWAVVLCRVSASDALRSATISWAWRGETLNKEQGDVTRADRKPRADTSTLLRAQRVYNELCFEMPVWPPPDTHVPSRGPLRDLLVATGARMGDPSCVKIAHRHEQAAKIQAYEKLEGDVKRGERKKLPPRNAAALRAIHEEVSSTLEALRGETDRESEAVSALIVAPRP